MADEIEIKCDACNGTGFPTVMQPVQPGKKIYPAPCKKCGGKGRIKKAPN
jgi:DnaJ-class molecular chaperone